MHYNQMLKEDEETKTGEKYSRGREYSRWGSNPGSILDFRLRIILTKHILPKSL